ncbi:LysR substrate-binding domain-containing protein [Oceanobacillus sp. FSL K6-2867]|uniref:LysR family transcriptional regulator n=1 Tax=Oceanobacillus sp. FSL K6-2867 TaxID=2954748 RepID=UPI0030D9A0CB
MDIRQLTYFLAIAEEGNITKAAKRLHIAQPPLSHQLKLLEEELGLVLIERNTRKIQITDAGKLLQNRARQIIELFERTEKELKDIKAGQLGTLSIGTISSVGETMLPIKIQRFHENYPGVDFRIKESSAFEIIEWVKDGIIEIGIVRTPFNLDTFECIDLPYEPMMAGASDLFWKGDEGCIDNLKEFEGKPLLVYNRFANNIEEACWKAGFEPRVICGIDDTRSMLNWANMGMGIAILPRDACSLISDVKLNFREIKEESLVTRIVIIWMKHRYLSTPAKNFLELFNT